MLAPRLVARISLGRQHIGGVRVRRWLQEAPLVSPDTCQRAYPEARVMKSKATGAKS